MRRDRILNTEYLILLLSVAQYSLSSITGDRPFFVKLVEHLSVISEYQWRFVNIGESLETCQHLSILLNLRENLSIITRRCTISTIILGLVVW